MAIISLSFLISIYFLDARWHWQYLAKRRRCWIFLKLEHESGNYSFSCSCSCFCSGACPCLRVSLLLHVFFWGRFYKWATLVAPNPRRAISPCLNTWPSLSVRPHGRTAAGTAVLRSAFSERNLLMNNLWVGQLLRIAERSFCRDTRLIEIWICLEPLSCICLLYTSRCV